jgi:hypothetical protein
MEKGVRLVAQCYDIKTGDIIEESVLRDDKLLKAETLKELGYLHVEQINFLQMIQDLKVKHQILLSNITCPNCGSKSRKDGLYKSSFHAALTDHEVMVQRMACKCGWRGPTSVEGIFGTNVHPDLLKKQALQGCKESYEKSSLSLNAESASKRSVNSHSQIYKAVKLVGEKLESVISSDEYGISTKASQELIANIDGGHIKARGLSRSFEAIVVSVHNPKNLYRVNKNHNIISSKTCVASAKDDKQETIKLLFKNACKIERLTKGTNLTCLADGAENCKSIADSIASYCNNVTYILDWFHIAMKFQNIAMPEEFSELFDQVKWNLWHGNSQKSLQRLDELKIKITDNSLITKLNKLYTYINNNQSGIVNYEVLKNSGLVFTSNLAESTVNTLINERQKGKQKMLWGREGAHNVLQIRSSIASKSWRNDWQKVEDKIYSKAA